MNQLTGNQKVAFENDVNCSPNGHFFNVQETATKREKIRFNWSGGQEVPCGLLS
jgi:hypothetical protein